MRYFLNIVAAISDFNKVRAKMPSITTPLSRASRDFSVSEPHEVEASLCKLARRLHEEMERLDPEGTSWNEVEIFDREILKLSIRAMLSQYADVLRIIKNDFADNDVVSGRSN